MNYKEVIEAKYNREAWRQLLHDIFQNKAQFWSSPDRIKVDNQLANDAWDLGKITLSDSETIGVYEVELSKAVDIQRNRRGIRDLLTATWHSKGYVGAFVFSYREEESVLRFSYVSEAWGFNKQGKYEKTATETLRYTYLLGEGRGCRTAIDRFTVLKNSKQTLSDITDAFSVEALTKQFYNELFAWYQWATDPATNVTFPNNTSIEKDDRENLETKIIRMITRIMFVWFIKQKGLVPDKLFDAKKLKANKILKNFDPLSSTSGNYYNAILQNLFFATLNRAIVDEEGNKRQFAKIQKNRDIKTLYRYAELFDISESQVIDMFAEVPFLNGGLFECLDKTKRFNGVEQDYNFDGFSRNATKFKDGRYKHRAVVPNILFFDEDYGLFSILNKYNFTIEENTPEEQQVALDPELLGRVFENLLGAYNPETKETARNESGSFYTPREIVKYMVDESLIAYLGDSKFIRSIFDKNFKYEESRKEEYEAVAEKLKKVKVLDPACGSGAFPMGILNRMMEILLRITPNINIYEEKLKIIENCLYGCDIQCIAAQITKLRFFISLIVDCEKNPKAPNFGIPVLPNLETKFVSADSLVGLRKLQFTQGFLFNSDDKKDDYDDIWSLRKKLAGIRHDHFKARSASRKMSLRKKDEDTRDQLSKLLVRNKEASESHALQLASWNPYDQNAVSKFFDPGWMFGVTSGFDIVIGNPPYIQLQNNQGELANRYEDCNFKTFARTGDIYCLFYERGQQLLKDGGHLCYITSNKWMRAGYGEKTRAFFAQETNPLLLIDFAGVKIFESATVDTNILLFAKSDNQHKTRCAVTNMQNKNGVKDLSDFVRQQGTDCKFTGSDSWVILSSIEQSIKRKIEAVGTPLKDWDINIYRGVLTGFNDAFIISTEKRDEILRNCKTKDERKRTADLIRPILRGRDIKRYGYEWANLWLIATHNGIKGKVPRIDIKHYPAVKAHLDKYWDKISTRADKGDTPYNLRNCAYMEDFNKLKIVWPRLMRISREENDSFPRFAQVEDGFLVTDSLCFFVGKNIDALGKYLNSELASYHYFKNIAILDNGGMQMRQQYIENVPCPPNVKTLKSNEDIYDAFHFTREEKLFIKKYVQEKLKEIKNAS